MYETRSTIFRLVDSCEVSSLPGNLAEQIFDLLTVSAKVDDGVGEHFIQGFNPVLLTVVPVFIAWRIRRDNFRLGLAAFRPVCRE